MSSPTILFNQIEREIQRLEPSEPARVSIPWIVRLRRLLVPAAGVALLVVAGLFALNPQGQTATMTSTRLKPA